MSGEGGQRTMMMVPDAVKAPVTASTESVLVVLYPPGAQLGRRYQLANDRHEIGRADTLDIPIEADSVSRRHACFVKTSAGWDLEDLGSTNGTFVNDERITRRALRDGDLCRFGAAILKFLSGANIEAAYHEEIYRTSIMDALTGVHNKRYFLEFLEREQAAAVRYNLPLSLVMFDIDFFKKVNDTYGHLAGDAVLAEVGKRIRPRMRREDLVARYGGEEFACVLTKTDVFGARNFAEALRTLISSQPFVFQDKQLPVTISLGVASPVATTATPPVELIRIADENLYAAKRGGRNRYVG